MTIRFSIFGVELATLTIELDHSPDEPVKALHGPWTKARKALAMTLIK